MYLLLCFDVFLLKMLLTFIAYTNYVTFFLFSKSVGKIKHVKNVKK